MTGFVDRLEQQLVGAERRSAVRHAGRLAARSASALVSVAVVVVVVAVFIGSGVVHRTPSSATGNHRPNVGPSASQSSSGAACGPLTNRYPPATLPPLVETDAPPDHALLSMLGSLRRAPDPGDHIDLHGLDRAPYDVVKLYRRYVRVVSGESGTRIAILPAIACALPLSGPLPAHLRLQPTLVLLMQVLNDPAPRPTVLVGTAAEIRSAQANPGLGTASGGWTQIAVVPDGVARVRMQFTPPYRPHYAVTVPIHDNVGIAVTREDFGVTIVTWYDHAGHVLKTYTDTSMLRAPPCLAKHRNNCR